MGGNCSVSHRSHLQAIVPTASITLVTAFGEIRGWGRANQASRLRRDASEVSRIIQIFQSNFELSVVNKPKKLPQLKT